MKIGIPTCYFRIECSSIVKEQNKTEKAVLEMVFQVSILSSVLKLLGRVTSVSFHGLQLGSTYSSYWSSRGIKERDMLSIETLACVTVVVLRCEANQIYV